MKYFTDMEFDYFTNVEITYRHVRKHITEGKVHKILKYPSNGTGTVFEINDK